MMKNVRKPVKGLMLTAMALLTATATLVNASSYSVRVEHIWDDNNNMDNTRPTEVVDTIIQGESVKKGENEYEMNPTNDNYDKLHDKGEGGGEDAALDKGYQAGMDAAAAIKKGEEQGVEGVEEDTYKNLVNVDDVDKIPIEEPENPEEPEPPAPELPDGVTKTEKPDDFKEEEPKLEAFNGDEEAYNEALKGYNERHDAYDEQLKAYEAYQEYLNSEAYQKYLNSEAYQKYLNSDAYKNYVSAKKVYDDYIALKKLSESTKGPDLSKDDPRFKDNEFIKGYEAALKDGYVDAFLKGFVDGIKGVDGSAPEFSQEKRTEYVDKITAALKDHDSKHGHDGADAADRAEKVMERVEALLKGDVIGNQWAEEKTDCDVKTENGKPANYDAAILDTKTLTDLAEAGTDKGYEGYTTVKMQVKVTLVKENENDVTRVYISLDGGKHWAPGDDATAQWDTDNHKTYDPTKEYVEETVITFLHTLVKAPEKPPEDPKTPKDDPDDPDDPDVPEDPKIPDEEVPLAEVPEVPEEPEEEPEEVEIPEEDVPLSEVPKTGDSSLLWMFAAMLSGTALLALLKKEKEAQEA